MIMFPWGAISDPSHVWPRDSGERVRGSRPNNILGNLFMSRVRRLSFGVVALALLLSGCSGKETKPQRYKVSGRLTSGGKPLVTKPMVGMIQVIFYSMPEGPRPVDPLKANIQPVYGRVDEEGQFTVHDGLTAGSYIVAV